MAGYILLRVMAIGVIVMVTLHTWIFHSFDEPSFVEGTVELSGQVMDHRYEGSTVDHILGNIAIDNQSVNGRVMLMGGSHAMYGELQATAYCERPDWQGEGYPRYLAAHGIVGWCRTFVPPQVIGDSVSFRSEVLQLRGWIMKRIQQRFGDPHAALLSGLLVGQDPFSDIWRDRIVRSGLSHVVAASGYNIYLVLACTSLILAGLFRRRNSIVAGCFTLVIGYVILAGSDAAIVRAGIMGMLLMLRTSIGRASTMTNVLLICAAGMLIHEPRLLRDDLGFQLSFATTIALVYLSPHIESYMMWISTRFQLREIASATFIATLASIPVLILKQMPWTLTGFWTNVLVLPLIPAIMCIGLFAVMLPGMVALPAVAATHAGLSYLLFIMWLGAHDIASTIMVIGLLIFLFLLCKYLLSQRNTYGMSWRLSR